MGASGGRFARGRAGALGARSWGRSRTRRSASLGGDGGKGTSGGGSHGDVPERRGARSRGAIAHPALNELGGRWSQGHVRGAVHTGTCRCAGCAVVGAIAHPALNELGGRWGQGHVRGRFTRGCARTPGCAVAGGDRAPACNVPGPVVATRPLSSRRRPPALTSQVRTLPGMSGPSEGRWCVERRRAFFEVPPWPRRGGRGDVPGAGRRPPSAAARPAGPA